MKKIFFSTLSLILAAGLVLCSACGSSSDEGGQTPGPSTPDPDPSTPSTPEPSTPDPVLSFGFSGKVGETDFVLPDLGGSVSVHTELQAKYLRSRTPGDIDKYANGVNATEELDHRDLSYPEPVSFTWSASGNADGYILSVSEFADMSEALTYETAEESAEVYNLKIGTTYYWTVTAGEDTSGAASFTTEGDAPRNMYVDGVANVRDLGGWPTLDGKRVRQGLIYRCGRLNENYTKNITITEKGIDTMLNEMKIVTEIDLRGGKNDPSEHGNISSSMLGNSVAYHHIGMNWEGNLLNLNREELREVFSILAKESSYPLIFHCSIGTDRTGIIAYFVNGLLGVDQTDLYRDYLFSNFAYIEGARDLGGILTSYVADVRSKAGKTLSQKIRTTLLEIGVTEAEIDSVVRILSE